MSANVHDLTPELRDRYEAAQQRLQEARKAAGAAEPAGPVSAGDLASRALASAKTSEPDPWNAMFAEELAKLPQATPEEMAEHAKREQERHDEERRQHERARRMAALETCGIRLRRQDYDALAAGNYEATEALQVARAWWAETGPGAVLCLHGAPGTGKTFAAASLVAEHGGKGVRSKHLARLAGSKWSEHVDEFEKLITFGGLLVVDDVGTEPDADAAKAALFELIDERQGSSGRTVLTTNLPLKDGKPGERLIDRVCARTLSRLHGCARFAGFKGSDMRRAKR